VLLLRIPGTDNRRCHSEYVRVDSLNPGEFNSVHDLINISLSLNKYSPKNNFSGK